MEQQHQKVVTISYLAVAALIAFIALTGLMKLSDMFDMESKVRSAELIIRVSSVVLGGLVFLILFKHETVNNFMNEVATELLTKVTWPERKETGTATAVVIVTVIIAGFLLGLLDWVWAMVLKALI